ncbi:MAG: ribonuclease P protein component [Chloroflexi bacterium]|nr:MAG: ribonuclease P protein component [Phototrophicales bacterium]RMF82782.1 MAG: ribonuclease P protein component [Chloroflexota bacterium]
MQRKFRIHTSNQFQRVRHEGRSYHHDLMVLLVAPNRLPFNRFGIITSRRVGKAVQRNRVRRLLREALRRLMIDMPSGYDIVVVAKSALVGQEFNTIVEVLRLLFRRAGLVEDLIEGW